MKAETHVSVFDESLQKTHVWLEELELIASLDSHTQAYSVLRVVLHALRDELPLNEAVDLAAELPMIIRGFYYEGWRPSAAPRHYRTREAFFDAIRPQIERVSKIDPAVAVGSVFMMLNHRISRGEIKDIRHVLPAPLRQLWPHSDNDA
jgi:uncharacterized protein (DUF2267 family)